MQSVKNLSELERLFVEEIETPLSRYRQEQNYQPVFGEGDPQADLLLVGEAPGRQEALTGRPFCGSAGRMLDRLLSEVGMERSKLYITNIVKDRPPGNRDPRPAELAAYGPVLDRQIEIVRPRAVAALGRHAVSYCLKNYVGRQGNVIMKNERGRRFSAGLGKSDFWVFPLYHPAWAVYNKKMIETMVKDMEAMISFLRSS